MERQYCKYNKNTLRIIVNVEFSEYLSKHCKMIMLVDSAVMLVTTVACADTVDGRNPAPVDR